MLNWGLNRGMVTADASEPDGPSMNHMQPPATQATSARSRIALALGGGAARGWAHIGVLRAFEEEGIEVSMIAASSTVRAIGPA